MPTANVRIVRALRVAEDWEQLRENSLSFQVSNECRSNLCREFPLAKMRGVV
jgi:hypothetical protein